ATARSAADPSPSLSRIAGTLLCATSPSVTPPTTTSASLVNIEGVTILNGYCDGIDPDCCHHVRIANCFVEAWDDAIVPKASFALGYRRSTENLTVTNCVLTTACNCFKLGTESSGDFKNITVSNCAMYSSPQLWKRKPSSGVSLEM